MNTLVALMNWISKFINVKMGLAGALVMGLIVLFINREAGWGPASVAALKQAGYTFLFGGILIKMLETIVLSIRSRWLAVTSSTLITSVVTIGLVYLVHSLKGTPMPFESTLPTIILAPPGFLAIAWRRRSKKEKQEDKK